MYDISSKKHSDANNDIPPNIRTPLFLGPLIKIMFWGEIHHFHSKQSNLTFKNRSKHPVLILVGIQVCEMGLKTSDL